MEKNYKPIEIDGINVPILLEDGLEYEFAKNALAKCDIKEFKDGDFIIFNKENMYVLHKTKPVPDDSVLYPKKMILCDKERKPITQFSNSMLIGNFGNYF